MPQKFSDEFSRVKSLVAGLTVSVPIVAMVIQPFARLDAETDLNATLAALAKELFAKLKAIRRPEDYAQMAQAYEAYSEVLLYFAMRDRGVLIERTPGTGGHGQKRPDFRHLHGAGYIYFELKALEIFDPLSRHKQMAEEALEIAAELDGRAKTPGVHFGRPQEISGYIPRIGVAERIDETIEKILNNVKHGQIEYGPTVLVIDLGRLGSMPFGPSSLLPVFFHDGPPAESAVTGELWQVALGSPGEQIFSLPEFDGKSNLGGHQRRGGVLREFPSLVGITFLLPHWQHNPELLTIWNPGWDQSRLANPCELQEHDIEELLAKYSDGLNDRRNELGWPYRVYPIREEQGPQ